MTRISLRLPETAYDVLMEHLSPNSRTTEELAFIFATSTIEEGYLQLKHLELFPVPPSGFTHRSGAHLELADEMRAIVIKRAHDLDACLVEVHSHPFSAAAAFSPSDLLGFEEFVPHVRWRLKGRPYLAIVVGPASFDALAWVGQNASPVPLDRLRVGHRALHPTGITFRQLQALHV